MFTLSNLVCPKMFRFLKSRNKKTKFSVRGLTCCPNLSFPRVSPLAKKKILNKIFFWTPNLLENNRNVKNRSKTC